MTTSKNHETQDANKRPTLTLKGKSEPAKGVTEPKPQTRGRKPTELVITKSMEGAVTRAKSLINGGCTKAETARDVYEELDGLSRKQIIHVYMEGCSLSRAGSSTYFQTIKSNSKPKT